MKEESVEDIIKRLSKKPISDGQVAVAALRFRVFWRHFKAIIPLPEGVSPCLPLPTLSPEAEAKIKEQSAKWGIYRIE